MEKITYKNVKTKVAGKPTGAKTQKSVADELIFALSKPKIKKEIKEEVVDEVPETVNKKLELKDFQATIANNLKSENDSGSAQTVKLSNKTAKKPITKAVAITKKATQDEKVALKTKVNNDWINFLKKRSDLEPPVADVDDDILEVEESPKPKPLSKKKRNIKHDVFSTELPVSKSTYVSPLAKSKTASASPLAKSNTPHASPKDKSKAPVKNLLTSKKDAEKDMEKDLVLKNLMAQVAQLETSMGANISKLESQLKEEKEKSKKLEDDLEAEKENYSDIATKLVGVQQNILKTEEANKKKIGEIQVKLDSEKAKSAELAKELSKLTKELSKIEKVRKDENKVREKLSEDLVSVAAEKEKLNLEVDHLNTWKEESITRIKANIMFCQEEHVQKIHELEDNIEMKSNIIVETNTRASMMMVEFSGHFNQKDKEIDSLNLKLEENEVVLKEKEKKLKDLESRLKDKESKYREKEENEEKYKEKVDRYREKEDRYREKEDKFKEKEKRFRDKEDKFIEVEKRLKEKEKKYKENEEKLRQKEDEMFRVYELVNQLQLRMKNDKINPIVNGQDILSIGKAKPVKSTGVKEDDEEICILPTPVKVAEKVTSPPKSSNGTKSKEHEKLKTKVNDPRLERKLTENDPRKKKSAEGAEHSTANKELKEKPLEVKGKTGHEIKAKPSFLSTKSTLVKLSDHDKRLPEADAINSIPSDGKKLLTSPVTNEHKSSVSSKPENRKAESSNKSSRRMSGNSRKDENCDKSNYLVVSTELANSSVLEKVSNDANIDVVSGIETKLPKLSPSVKGQEHAEETKHGKNTVIESIAPKGDLKNSLNSSSPKVNSTIKVLQGHKRKLENEPKVQPTKRPTMVPAVSLEEDEILLLDDDDDDIQCVMEIKAPSDVNPVTCKENVDKSKTELKEAVKNLLTEENTKVSSVVASKAVDNSVDDNIELMELDLPEPVPCVDKSEVKSANERKLQSRPSSCNKSRMKASDFFIDIEVNSVDHTSEVKDMEKITTSYDEGLELENWISKQLRLERERIEQGSTDELLDDSIESVSDSSHETLKQMFLQDLELQPVDQNENQTLSKPIYVNPDIEWKLTKWPNLPQRLTLSDSPNPKDSECKIVHETEVSDPRLRKKYGLDASGLKMSFQQRVAMRKVDKEDETFIPRSTRVLMLPYLWPLVKYVKKDLMQFFDDSSLLRSTKDLETKNIPIIELDDQEDEATISLLYDDLDVDVPEDVCNSPNFSTKRTWDEMKQCDLSLERSKIIDELRLELNRSTVSNSSCLDESSSNLLMVSFEEPDISDHSTKRLKMDDHELTLSEEDTSFIRTIIQDVIEGCFQQVGVYELEASFTVNEDGISQEGNNVTEWSDDNFDYKCTFLPVNLSEELDNIDEKEECEDSLDSSSNVSSLNKSGLRQSKFKPVKRKFSKGSVRRYLGSKRCFGRSLC